MKKILVSVLAVLALSGCKMEGDYDEALTAKQAREACEELGGVGMTFVMDNRVRGNPWRSNCLNKSTGNTFSVNITGVLKQ